MYITGRSYRNACKRIDLNRHRLEDMLTGVKAIRRDPMTTPRVIDKELAQIQGSLYTILETWDEIMKVHREKLKESIK